MSDISDPPETGLERQDTMNKGNGTSKTAWAVLFLLLLLTVGTVAREAKTRAVNAIRTATTAMNRPN